MAATAIALAVGRPCPAQTANADPGVSTSALWRSARNCGANCLFLLLRAEGREVGYDQVLRATRIGPKGSTLLDLRTAAKELGAEARLGKGTVADLAGSQLPVMVHFDPPTGDVTATGHYVLVTAVDTAREVVEVFDGASALRSEIALSAFKRAWSGYVMELTRVRDRNAKLAITASSLVLAFAFYAWRRRTQLRVVPGGA